MVFYDLIAERMQQLLKHLEMLATKAHKKTCKVICRSSIKVLV